MSDPLKEKDPAQPSVAETVKSEAAAKEEKETAKQIAKQLKKV